MRKLSHKPHNQKNRASWTHENTNSQGMMQTQSYCLFVGGFEGQLSAMMQSVFLTTMLMANCKSKLILQEKVIFAIILRTEKLYT